MAHEDAAEVVPPIHPICDRALGLFSRSLRSKRLCKKSTYVRIPKKKNESGTQESRKMGGGRRRFVRFLIPFILWWTFYTVSQQRIGEPHCHPAAKGHNLGE